MKIRSRGCRRLLKSKPNRQLELRDATAGGLTVSQLQMLQHGFVGASGTVVNEQTCLSVSAAYACINLISSTIASLDYHVYQRLSDGAKKPAPRHAAERTINFWDHLLTNRHKGWQALMVNVLTMGNGFAEIGRLPNGSPETLYIQLSRNVELKEEQNGDLYYWLRKEGKRIEPENMLHISCLGFSGVEGIGPVRAHSVGIGNALSQQEYLNHLFANDSTPKGYLKAPIGVNKQLTDDALKRSRDTWNELQAGVTRAGSIAVLPYGYDYQQTQLSPGDIGLIAQNQYSVAYIGRIYGVPLPMLNGEITGETPMDMKQQWIDLSLRSWLASIEAECHKKLFSPTERCKYFCEFRLEGLLKGDPVARSTYYKNLWSIAAINAGEIRSAEGLNPYEGSDKFYLPVNNVASVDDGVLAGTTEESPNVVDDPTESAPATDPLVNSIEPILYTEVGRLVRRGFNQLRKDPTKLDDFTDHCKEALGSFVGIVGRVNPLSLDQLVASVLEGTRAVQRECEIGDYVRATTRKILAIDDVPNK